MNMLKGKTLTFTTQILDESLVRKGLSLFFKFGAHVSVLSAYMNTKVLSFDIIPTHQASQSQSSEAARSSIIKGMFQNTNNSLVAVNN